MEHLRRNTSFYKSSKKKKRVEDWFHESKSLTRWEEPVPSSRGLCKRPDEPKKKHTVTKTVKQLRHEFAYSEDGERGVEKYFVNLSQQVEENGRLFR